MNLLNFSKASEVIPIANTIVVYHRRLTLKTLTICATSFLVLIFTQIFKFKLFMKTLIRYKIRAAALLSALLLFIASCSPQIKLTSSWANRQATVKNAPVIMVLVLGKANSSIRQDVENNMVARLKKEGYTAVPASGIIQPGIVKHDSAELVNILRKNNIDMLLTNAVVSKTENERFIPGAIQSSNIAVPAGGAASAYNQYNGVGVYVGYNSYYNYYSANNSYQIIDAPKTPGTTVTDVFIVIESNLYNVAAPELIWHGQTTSYTKQPTSGEIKTFSKEVISDIIKNKLLIK
jgi:hypothetical protein